jgi:hypothetical protein
MHSNDRQAVALADEVQANRNLRLIDTLHRLYSVKMNIYLCKLCRTRNTRSDISRLTTHIGGFRFFWDVQMAAHLQKFLRSDKHVSLSFELKTTAQNYTSDCITARPTDNSRAQLQAQGRHWKQTQRRNNLFTSATDTQHPHTYRRICV